MINSLSCHEFVRFVGDWKTSLISAVRILQRELNVASGCEMQCLFGMECMLAAP